MSYTTPSQLQEGEAWTVDDPRMWKEQCRVGDVAFQHLFCTSKGKPVPDWVKDGLPQLYHLLSAYDKVNEEYMELIMAVARKFPGETRHQTALRYIKEAEAPAKDSNKSTGMLPLFDYD